LPLGSWPAVSTVSDVRSAVLPKARRAGVAEERVNDCPESSMIVVPSVVWVSETQRPVTSGTRTVDGGCLMSVHPLTTSARSVITANGNRNVMPRG
jgi:hypothetical protein